MKTVKLKSISLLNFRGVQKFELNDIPTVLDIHGRNGSGKTSIYDAWLWLLFGKDHEGRSDHELKPKGENRVNVEVEAEILVNEKQTSLRRVYREEWIKPRGENEEIFKGNTTDYYINDVGVKKSDYDQAVADICEETLFKTVTNPHYFTSLKKEQQRDILFSLIPEITNEQIASQKPEFEELLKYVTGVSFDNFKKELLARKRRIKEQLERIPTEIETTNRNMPETDDWDEIEAKIKSLQADIEKIDLFMTDALAKGEEEQKEVLAIQEKINQYLADNAKLERIEKQQIADDIERKENEIRRLLLSIGDDERDYKTKKSRKDSLEKDLKYYQDKIESLRKQWKEINAEKLEFNENELICPTCKQQLPEQDIEERRNHMQEAFNKSKSERLAANLEDGKKIRQMVDSLLSEIQHLNIPDAPDTSEKQTQIEKLKAEIQALKEKKPQYRESILFKANEAKIRELREKISVPVDRDSIDMLKNNKRTLQSEIDALKKRLYNREIIENLKKSLDEINERKSKLNQELAKLEQQEFTIKEFEFAKNTEYESRINMLFEKVQFRLFKEQVDGQVVPDCEATMNGTNYSTLSNAEKIYAGLDIINGIGSSYDICAPIFIDNRESTTVIPEMQAQIINLYVDPTCEILTIK
jgi:DNA repair exonuclease SbcCD ATPase subunit